MRAFLALVLNLAAGRTFGHDVDRETFTIIGWNEACSVAIAHYGFPALGQGIYEEPVRTRIGTLTIRPGADTAQTAWEADWDGAGTWNTSKAKASISNLGAAGYDQAGFMETVRPDRIGAQPGLEETIRSTATFALRSTAGWPGPGWRWRQVFYSPLGDCGLFVFAKTGVSRPFYRALLLRIYNASARTLRSRAHVTNALLLLGEGDMAGALEEASIAARMTPQLALARYHYAALLCLSGRLTEAETELAAAVQLDPQHKKQAREDRDFESLHVSPRFQSIIKD